MVSCPGAPLGPPAPIAPAKSMGGLAGYELWRTGLVNIPSEPKGPALCPTHWPARGVHPLLLAGHKGLEAWGHAKAQLMDVRWLFLAVDLHPDASLKRRLICTVETGTFGKPSQADSPGQSPQVSLSRLHTCLSPDGQVLLLLDVQHDLQAAAHAPHPAGKGALWICIEGITFPIASIDLGWGGMREKRKGDERRD